MVLKWGCFNLKKSYDYTGESLEEVFSCRFCRGIETQFIVNNFKS